MGAKKPLLLAVLILALLAVGLILPPAVSGANDNQPVNWVAGNYNTYSTNLPYSHTGFTLNVREVGNEPPEGFVLQKIMLTSDPDFADAPVVRRATEFVLEGDWRSYWSLFGLADMYLDGYAAFYGAGEPPGRDEWSEFFPDIGEVPLLGLDFTPTNLVDYSEANIADFVVSLPAGFLPPPFSYDLWPHRYVIVDFGEPGQADLVQIYGWVPVFPAGPVFPGFGFWLPLLSVNGDLVPVPAGNFQVHVGASD